MDDNRCAYAFLSHRKGNVWNLIKDTDKKEYKEMAIKAAIECPAGRLQTVDKTESNRTGIRACKRNTSRPGGGGKLRDICERQYSLESADGELYEIRNRYTLCRCEKSRNKPFCDATHVPLKFSDKNCE